MIQNDPEKTPEDLALEVDARACLAHAGIRLSEERVRLLSLLMKFKDRAWTAPDLRRLSAGPADDMTITTRLYRSLHLLEQKGVVAKEVRDTHGRPSFTYRLVGHEAAVQLRCRSCNRIVAADSAPLRAQVEKAAIQAGLAIASEEMLVLVTCSRCAAGVNVDTNGLQ